MKSPFISVAEIKRHISPYYDKVSTDTIKRRLQIKFGMSSRKSSKKPLITQKIRKKRLAFCKQHKKLIKK